MIIVTTDNAWLSFKFKKYPNPSSVAMNTFLNCYQNDHSCHALVDGIYYPCGSAGRFHVLSKFTNNLFPPMKNGIDIYKVTSLEEILDFISTPIPLCQYCPVADIYYTTWDRSKKLLEEWIH